ncbi:Glycerol-3-phosphate dehydrogenase [Plesiocystis pacifica SIR-1]|uniref:Glycerol-3-phosphate dehydrogenase [NAD(P)+] n=1 Tax=Plesiocystis pacifica SIR-1 TaxID=391625 RepID=A6GD43_9BACT|nr:NAD(P)H-dependent glycerol-3-phosphate dehydrogenase [Plesiocystis pacifica]EDM76201.1 Glycerol-3-phosphate dehydrogenase [Plesiocystis pacifica SIR-1]
MAEHTTATTRVSVLGAGNWGTTVAHLIGQNGIPVTLWGRNEESCAEINEQRRNSRYLKGLELSEHITATTELAKAVEEAELLFLVIPSQAFRSVCADLGDLVRPNQLAVHATKGLELGTGRRMTEIIRAETCLRQIGVLSGPNIAREMCAGKPAGTVVASRFPRVIEVSREVLKSHQLRVYGNTDVVGVELGGTLKNIIAIAAGMATQMELGENAKSLLITRGLSEIARLGVALGADPMTFSGLAGIGDLMVTCASPLSRNHRVGAALARGMSLKEAVDSLGMVAEGVKAAKIAEQLTGELGLRAPLMHAVYRVLYDGLTPAEGLRELMTGAVQEDIDPSLTRAAATKKR